MAEFTLPKNSKIKPGKNYPAKPDAKDVRTFRIYRWNPDDGENPHIDDVRSRSWRPAARWFSTR